MTELSVIVPAYNRARIIRHCLKALCHQTLEKDRYEVVVVDDASTDETPVVVGAFASSGPCKIRYLRRGERGGPGAARNTGILQAQGWLVVFVDSDVIVTPGFLEEHLRLHEENGIVGRGPVILVPTLDGQFPRRARLIDLSTNFLDTANASVRKDHLLQAGLFDEGFSFYGWEDLDLGMRLHRLGLRKRTSRRAIAYHLQPPLTAQRMPELIAKEQERARNAVRFYRKYPCFLSRVTIQRTLLHRAIAWALSGGGTLTPDTALPVLEALERRGWKTLHFLVMRGVLNRVYLEALEEAWRSRSAEIEAKSAPRR
ncbi:MAG: glycosyltransferase [Armatimonadota bacterium]|nr:glycosyltransferase [Armatimonadota bacterium]